MNTRDYLEVKDVFRGEIITYRDKFLPSDEYGFFLIESHREHIGNVLTRIFSLYTDRWYIFNPKLIVLALDTIELKNDVVTFDLGVWRAKNKEIASLRISNNGICAVVAGYLCDFEERNA